MMLREEHPLEVIIQRSFNERLRPLLELRQHALWIYTGNLKAAGANDLIFFDRLFEPISNRCQIAQRSGHKAVLGF